MYLAKDMMDILDGWRCTRPIGDADRIIDGPRGGEVDIGKTGGHC
jgi:hypothetical protein